MGRPGEAEREMGESGPEHVHSLTLPCDRRLYNGQNCTGNNQRTGRRCFQLVDLFLSDVPEKRADVREVAGSSGDGADSCLFPLPDVCLKCRYFAVTQTAAVDL